MRLLVAIAAVSLLIGAAHAADVTVTDDQKAVAHSLKRACRFWPNRRIVVRIVFAGGNANVIFHAPPESEFAARMLENLGIRREHIELESSSRNTRENAINTMKLVMPKPGERWLLITSAYHMPRAIGLFRKVGFPVEAYPVDWQTGGWSDLVPMSFSFLGETKKLDLAVHEWAGLIFDWLSGRTSAIFPGQ